MITYENGMRQPEDMFSVAYKRIVGNKVIDSLVLSAILLSLTHCGAINGLAQSIQSAYPATEYIRMNGQVIAAEHMAPPSAAISVSLSPQNITVGPGQQ